MRERGSIERGVRGLVGRPGTSLRGVHVLRRVRVG